MERPTTTQKRVTLWDVSSGSPRARASIDLSGSPRFEPILSPDKQRLAIDLGRDSAAVGIFNIATKHQIARLAESGAKLELSGYAASPDGRFFATGYSDGRVTLWNAREWTKVRSLRGHSQKVEALSFSPDSRLLATGSADNTIRLWNTGADSEFAVLRGDTGETELSPVPPQTRRCDYGPLPPSPKLIVRSDRKP